MTIPSFRMKQVVAILVVAAAIGVGFSLADRAISADANPADECPGIGKPESQFMGADSCALCHTKNSSSRASELATLEEFPIWKNRDQHSHAFAALTSPRALQMEKLLDRGKVTENRQCLACHAIDLTADSAGPTLSDKTVQLAAVAQGVSCEACHGRASLWIDPHWKSAKWSKSPLAEKRYKEFGMTNLRDPVRRTELCLSCHLGNIECRKFVTHEMFAAGHPPLAAFEIESFLEQMPPHWRPVAPGSRTRSVALEGLVMLRASIRLIADANRAPGPKDHADSIAGDFAVYDCAACHHELQVPSARQERGYSEGAPGRPALKNWNLPLANAMREVRPSKKVRAFSEPSPLDDALARLHTATRGRPFGDPHAVEVAARYAIAQLDDAIEDLRTKPVDNDDPRLLVRQLCRTGAEAPLDYESAWQLTGALRAVVSDGQNSAVGQSPRPFDPKIKPLIDDLSRLVHFPPAPTSATAPPPTDGGTLWQSGTDFNAEEFHKKLEAIVKLLGTR